MQPCDIDALVAEKAFGWEWWTNQERRMRVLVGPDPWVRWNWRLPRFSTDPAASKQLRDRMRELGWQYTLGGADGQPYIAKFWKENGGDWLVDRSDTEEMAVALAALKALGAEIPG